MAWFDRNSGGKKSVESEPVKHEPVKQPGSPKTQVEPVAAAASPEPKPIAKPEAPPQPSTAGLVGFLYKGSRVSGQLIFQGPARIDGMVDGEVQCHGALTIGEGAEVRAKVSGQVVVIRGKVEGNVTAKEKVELLAPARLIGNVTAPRLAIAEGVIFDGDCSMGVAKQKSGNSASQSLSGERAAAAPTVKLQADSNN